PYDDNWNITLQRELTPAMSISVGYVATRGSGQLETVDFNSPVFGLGTTQSRRPHPEHGGTGVGASWGHRWYDSLQVEWRTRLRTLSLWASYTWAHQLTLGGGGINEALQLARFGWNEFGVRPPVLGSSLPTSDPYLAADKGPGGADVRQRFVVSYVWDIP